MTYRCGIGDGMQALGLEPGPPMVRCDYPGCAAFVEAKATRGGAPAWLRNKKAPKGWTSTFHPSGKRYDLCPAHRPGKAVAAVPTVPQAGLYEVDGDKVVWAGPPPIDRDGYESRCRRALEVLLKLDADDASDELHPGVYTAIRILQGKR